MRTPPLLIEATPTTAFAVRVAFEDGTAGEVDLAYLVEYGGVFEPLRDPDYFRRLRADPEAGTIVWPNEPTSRPRRYTPTPEAKSPRRRNAPRHRNHPASISPPYEVLPCRKATATKRTLGRDPALAL